MEFLAAARERERSDADRMTALYKGGAAIAVDLPMLAQFIGNTEELDRMVSAYERLCSKFRERSLSAEESGEIHFLFLEVRKEIRRCLEESA